MAVWKKIIVLACLCLFLAGGVVGCEKEGSGEKAGKKVDEAVDAAKDKLKKLTE